MDVRREYINNEGNMLTIADLKVMKHEVTVGQYRVCVTNQQCTHPDNQSNWTEEVGFREEQPILGLSPNQAIGYATWMGNGARIPTQDEWIYIMSSTGT